MNATTTAVPQVTSDLSAHSAETWLAAELPAISHASSDPAERLEFSRPPRGHISRFDPRSDSELLEVVFDHDSALERERAAWEYADRHRESAAQHLVQLASGDPDPSVRWTTLWLLQKTTGSADLIARALADDHPEVRDWARLLLREIDPRSDARPEERRARVDGGNPFDQTLPLTIAGYARVSVPGIGWVQATLSPKWFELVMGRVMACTRRETFDTDLVIEKRIEAMHPDGSNHYEIYHFKGFTQPLSDAVSHHLYEARACHTFYPSGKVEDDSIQPLDDVIVNVVRQAETIRAQHRDAGEVVQSVRGRYMGTAAVNLRRVIAQGMRIGAGDVQLSNVHHPIAGPLTNTLLFGTFKGKLSDLDGDGWLDVNTERCHGTVDGRLDYHADGAASPDPFDFYGREAGQ